MTKVQSRLPFCHCVKFSGRFFARIKKTYYICTSVRNTKRIGMVDVAQSVRASDCGSEGRGFEPHLPPEKVFFRRPFSLADSHIHPCISMICRDVPFQTQAHADTAAVFVRCDPSDGRCHSLTALPEAADTGFVGKFEFKRAACGDSPVSDEGLCERFAI